MSIICPNWARAWAPLSMDECPRLPIALPRSVVTVFTFAPALYCTQALSGASASILFSTVVLTINVGA